MSLSDALGIGSDISYKGQVYRLAPVDTLNVQGRYSKHLKTQAVVQIQEMRADLDPMIIDQMLAAVTRDFAAGLYRFGGQIVRDSLKVVSNQERLFLYMLQEYQPKVTPILAKEIFDNEPEQVIAALDDTGPKAQAPNSTTG